MQSGKKRESSEPKQKDAKKQKQEVDAAKITAAIEANMKRKEAITKTIDEAKETISEAQSVVTRRNAADIILAFMKAHQTGMPSALLVRTGDLSAILIGVFQRYIDIPFVIKRDPETGTLMIPSRSPESNSVIALIEGYLGKDALCGFASNVNVASKPIIQFYSGRDDASFSFGDSRIESFVCKKENLFLVGDFGHSTNYIFYTNQKK